MATTAGFKQPCPSCEHPVPIRDPKLVGRKIDCPKCKYRFVVEDPGAGDDEEAKKGKKETAVKAGAAKGAAPAAKKPMRRRDDDDDDDDDKPQKKAKGGSSTTLLIGVGIGLVAIVLLAIGGYVMFGGDDSGNKTAGAGGSRPAGGGAMTPPGGAGPGEGAPTDGEGPPKEEKPTAPPPSDDTSFTTNLLPNDTEMVVSARMDKVLNSAIGKDISAAFNTDQFQQRFGFPLESVKRIIQASSQSKDWSFTVLFTDRDVNWPAIQASLVMEKGPRSPIGGKEYFLVKGDLDPFSNVFIKNSRNKPLGAYKHDDHTLVLAEIEPLERFLEAGGRPKFLSELPTARSGDGEGEGGDAAGGAGGMGMPGPGAMGAGMGGPGAMAPPGMAGPPGGMSGPPGGMGMMGGPMGPGGKGMAMGGDAPGGADGGAASPQSAVAHSWMTVKPILKRLLDRAESAKPGSFVCVAMEGEQATKLTELLSGVQVEGVDLGALQKNVKGTELKAAGLGLQNIQLEKLTGIVSLEFKNTQVARSVDQAARLLLPLLAAQFEKELGMRVTIANQQQPREGGFGPGGFGPGGFGPGGMMPPGGGGMMPPGGGSMPPGGMMPPGGGSMPPGGGGMMPPMPGPGMPGPGGVGSPDGGGDLGGFGPGGFGRGPGGGQENPNQSTVGLTVVNDVATMNVDLALNEKGYDLFHGRFLTGIVRLKGQAEMVGGRARIHELAAALRTHVQRRGTFPRGTFDRPSTAERAGRPFPPDERISWMADVLRYLPHYQAAFGNQTNVYPLGIDPSKSWRDKDNLLPAQTLVGPFLDHRTSEALWWVSYPRVSSPVAATHFVGVAGVGLDAAEVAGPKQQGVFGYDRTTTPSQIADGLENTIAVLQVPPVYKTPWLAGGGSTVRGIPEKDCVKPFVCTEYQGKKGALAIMASGDVRFIPEDIKDEDFKALCTIAGGEKVDIEVLTRLVPPPKDATRAVSGPPVAPSAPAKPDAAKPEAPKAPAGDGGKPTTQAPGGNDKVLVALGTHCAQCHTGARSKGKTQIFTAEGVLNSAAPKEKMAAAVAEGKMPPRMRPRPSGEDLALLQQYFNGAN